MTDRMNPALDQERLGADEIASTHSASFVQCHEVMKIDSALASRRRRVSWNVLAERKRAYAGTTEPIIELFDLANEMLLVRDDADRHQVVPYRIL